MTYTTLEIERRGPAAWLWMNRPALHNAFDETLIAAGTIPKRTSEVANCAAVDATQMSQADASPMPPPSAAP